MQKVQDCGGFDMKFEHRYTEYKVTYLVEQSDVKLNGKFTIHNDEKNIKKALQKQIRIMWGFRNLGVTILNYNQLTTEKQHEKTT